MPVGGLLGEAPRDQLAAKHSSAAASAETRPRPRQGRRSRQHNSPAHATRACSMYASIGGGWVSLPGRSRQQRGHAPQGACETGRTRRLAAPPPATASARHACAALRQAYPQATSHRRLNRAGQIRAEPARRKEPAGPWETSRNGRHLSDSRPRRYVCCHKLDKISTVPLMWITLNYCQSLTWCLLPLERAQESRSGRSNRAAAQRRGQEAQGGASHLPVCSRACCAAHRGCMCTRQSKRHVWLPPQLREWTPTLCHSQSQGPSY